MNEEIPVDYIMDFYDIDRETALEYYQDEIDAALKLIGMNNMLLDRVIEQMKEDIGNGDWTAIVEMLSNLPTEILDAYLPEDIEKSA